jgi:putative Holliday junction resolvase
MKRVMAVDWGEKRIGVAFNQGTPFSFPYKVIEVESEEGVNQVLALAQELKAEVIVVGLPLHLNASFLGEAQRIENFKNRLEQSFEGKVVLWDERLSTKEAEKRLIEADLSRKKRKNVIDKISAALVLETYLSRVGDEI